MNKNSTFRVNTEQFKNNIDAIFISLNEGVSLIPILKANAYGHGLLEIAKIIEKDNRIERVGIAHPCEGIALRKHGFSKSIMLLGAIMPSQIKEVIQNNLEPLIHNLNSLKVLNDYFNKENITNYPVHLKINTGLNRLGFNIEELDDFIYYLKNINTMNIISTYSHFVEGIKVNSALTQNQNNLFLKAIDKLEKNQIHYGFKHICDSGAFEWFKEAHYEAVRIGRALYMDNPNKKEAERYKDVASWTCKLVSKRKIKANENIGYGQILKAEKEMEVGIINIGYGDGLYPFTYSQNAFVSINKQKCKILSVAMDQTYVDITNINVEIDDNVLIFGEDNHNYVSSNELAKILDDEGVTLTTQISNRVGKIYY